MNRGMGLFGTQNMTISCRDAKPSTSMSKMNGFRVDENDFFVLYSVERQECVVWRTCAKSEGICHGKAGYNTTFYYKLVVMPIPMSHVAGTLFDASSPYGTTITAVVWIRNHPFWCPIVLRMHPNSNGLYWSDMWWKQTITFPHVDAYKWDCGEFSVTPQISYRWWHIQYI